MNQHSLLTTNDLTISLEKKTICQQLNWQLKTGEIWGLLGPNGSGKTTLLHTLAGLHKPSMGEIYLHEKKLHSLSRKDIARQLGILFQDTQFVFPQTVYEYAYSGRFPHKSTTEENQHIVTQALVAMELEKLTLQKVHSLSGGEKRRLAIATVIAQQPAIYLLDEPTNHLDLRHQLRVMSHYKKLAETQPIGILISMHDIALAKRYCHKLLMLFPDGKTIQGTTDNVLTDKHIEALYQLDPREYYL